MTSTCRLNKGVFLEPSNPRSQRSNVKAIKATGYGNNLKGWSEITVDSRGETAVITGEVQGSDENVSNFRRTVRVADFPAFKREIIVFDTKSTILLYKDFQIGVKENEVSS